MIAGILVSIPAEGVDVRLLSSVVRCVGGGLRDEPITGSEESYRVCVCNCVWSRNLESEAAWARFGLLRHGKESEGA